MTAIVAGNGLEFYDFLIYAIFAVYIGEAFFPATSAEGNLLESLAVFGIGFVTRPIGAVVLGRLGDRIGRKNAMLVSFWLMGVGIIGLMLTPTYARIGIAAPILVVLFRLIQGFAIGGDIGPTTTYLTETAPPHRRGLYGAMQAMSQGVASVLAALVGVLLSLVLPADALAAWGWRLAMLPGALIIPFAIAVRRNLPETLHRAADPIRQPIEPRHRKLVFLAILALGAGTIGLYTTLYMPTYALTVLHMPAASSFAIGLVGAMVALVTAPVSGHLSDRFGRRTLMIAGSAIGTLTIIPGYWLIVHQPSAWTLYPVIALVTFASSLATTPLLTTITESFPARIRCSALAITYAVAITIFGGSTQFVLAWLIHYSGDPMAIAYYRAAAVAIGLVAVLMIAESAPARARPRAAALAPA